MAVLAVAAGLGLGSPSGAGSAPSPPSRQAGDEQLGIIGGVLVARDGSERRPVEGVELAVKQGGRTVETVTSDDKGLWNARVPRGEGYSVTIDIETLPDGVDLRDEDKATVSDLKVSGLRRPVVFPLGPRAAATPLIERTGVRVAAGLRVGLIVGMAAVGLSLIFGVTGLVNFAHGEMVTFGALMAYLFSSRGGVASLPLVVAAVVAVAAGALFGGALETALFAPLRRRGTGNVALIVFTIGLSLMLRYTYSVVFDNNPRPYRQFATQQGVVLGLAPKDFFVIGVAAVAMLAVGALLQGTRLGTAMRAVADNRDLAASSGIDVKRIIRAVWVMGGALAALGGVLFGTTLKVEWDLGYQQLLLMFAAVVLGGLGSAYGAMVGGLIVGLASEVSTLWIPVDFKTAVALAVLIVVLLVRPQGVLGIKERLG